MPMVAMKKAGPTVFATSSTVSKAVPATASGVSGRNAATKAPMAMLPVMSTVWRPIRSRGVMSTAATGRMSR